MTGIITSTTGPVISPLTAGKFAFIVGVDFDTAPPTSGSTLVEWTIGDPIPTGAAIVSVVETNLSVTLR